MKLQCPQCSAVYTVDPDKIPEKGARLQCKKCKGVIIVPAPSRGSGANDPDEFTDDAITARYISGKDEDAAADALFQGICEFVEKKQFDRAEKLREKLMEAAPMALTQILESGEIIENAKLAAIDSEAIQPWADFFDSLTGEETADVYFLLTPLTVPAGQSLFQQGQHDNRLFFIRSGQMQLSYHNPETKDAREVAILKKGDIAGKDPFFAFTNHTTTLTALKEAELFYINRNDFDAVAQNHPGIRAKLEDYSKKTKERISVGEAKSGIRRTHPRYEVELKGVFQRINTRGEPAGDPTRTTIVDIAAGGICFMLRHLNTEDAEKMHKSWIKITFSHGEGPEKQNVTKIARVLAVRTLPFDESTVHVQFKKPLSEEQMAEIQKYAATK